MLQGEGLLNLAGEAFAPSQAPGKVLAAIDLDHHISAAVEGGVPLLIEPAGFLLGFVVTDWVRGDAP
ncbi:hypothetical protein D3C80_1832310 [compost metagenome]